MIVEQNIDLDFVRRWFLPAGSRITDVITMLMNADTFSGSSTATISSIK
jgi:hypothetical protein